MSKCLIKHFVRPPVRPSAWTLNGSAHDSSLALLSPSLFLFLIVFDYLSLFRWTGLECPSFDQLNLNSNKHYCCLLITYLSSRWTRRVISPLKNGRKNFFLLSSFLVVKEHMFKTQLNSTQLETGLNKLPNSCSISSHFSSTAETVAGLGTHHRHDSMTANQPVCLSTMKQKNGRTTRR